jgi:hypothetical protein
VKRVVLFNDFNKYYNEGPGDKLQKLKEMYMRKYGEEEQGNQQQSGETPSSSKAAETNDDEGSETSDDDDVEGIFTHPATAEPIKFFFMNYSVNSCSRAIKSVMRRLVMVSFN